MYKLKAHRRSPKYMVLWWIATWIFQIPKATIQATLGGLPYSMHVIPGPEGLTKGLYILRASAFSVLLMAPIGVFLTSMIGEPMAKKLREMDADAGYDDNDKITSEVGTSPPTSPVPLRSKNSDDDDDDGEKEVANEDFERKKSSQNDTIDQDSPRGIEGGDAFEGIELVENQHSGYSVVRSVDDSSKI